MKTTIREIAARAGVSVITVSRALNNHPKVRQETRELVQDIARELNYIPNFNARALAGGSSYTLGAIVPDNANPYFAEMMCGIEEIARSQGYMVILCNTNETQEQERIALKMLKQKRVDGLLLTPNQYTNAHLGLLISQNIPFVLLNRHIDGFDADCVVNDNQQGAYDATSYLCKLGHHQILHLTGSEQISSVRERLLGYRKALEDNDVPFDPGLVFHTDLKLEGGFKKIKQALGQLSPLPTAIFAYSDLLAFGALKALREANLNIPDDISLVGYDDIDYSSFMNPPLTTVSQQAYEIGRQGTEILFEKINKRDENIEWQTHRIVYRPKLVIRQSCKSPLPNHIHSIGDL